MKRIVIVFCCFATLATHAQHKKAPVITMSNPASAAMSLDRLRYVDETLQKAVNDKWVNGLQALVVRDGKIAYSKSFGYNDMEKKTPMPADGIFRIASQTKAITSVAIMMLYERGKLLLDDKVSKYIPSFTSPVILDKYNPLDTTYTTVPATNEITIRHLLTHTSGIGYSQIGEGALHEIYAKNYITCGLRYDDKLVADEMRLLGTMPLKHNPGEAFTYGLNTDVLGAVVEIVSGMPLDKFFQKNIFEPLGMKDTYFYLPEDKKSRLVNLYIADTSTGLKKSPGYFEVNNILMKDYPASRGRYFSGGAGLVSTIMDYAIFLQMMLNEGEYNGKRILGRNTVRMMTVNQIGKLNCGDQKFGLGFIVITNDGSTPSPQNTGSFGWMGAFSTYYWVDPKEKLVGILYRQLWNDVHEMELNEKFLALVYQAINN